MQTGPPSVSPRPLPLGRQLKFRVSGFRVYLPPGEGAPEAGAGLIKEVQGSFHVNFSVCSVLLTTGYEAVECMPRILYSTISGRSQGEGAHCCTCGVLEIVERNQPDGPTNLKLGRLVLHHWKDWVFVVLLFGLYVVLEIIHPYRRYIGALMFSTGRYSYPLLHQTVPAAAVPVIAIVIPIVFILGFFIWARMSRDLHHSILGLLTAVLLTAVITDALKDGLGYQRPDFYARCFGSLTAPAAYGPDGNVQCNGSASDLKQGYKSFPSGHASWSFAGLGYLSMYLAGKLGFFDKQGHSWKLFPIVLPLLGATLVGISRVDNYWHNWFDVFVGALIGLIVAYFCYRQHYPSLFDDAAASPLPFIGHRQGTNVVNSNPPSQYPGGVPMSDYPAV